ncbi:THAP domain containing 9 [Plakobranchus ocellatus]|uniref:THAP domain containing 9 n=1 Tax=Plakobranchus ocellatus TaxID=259542 RepID=A0AAV4AMG9_9GAST|nr:THAP domain containing 9 [Plakobranchus ocellatus]
MCLTDQNLPQGPGVPEALERAVLQEVGTDIAAFYDMLAHMLDTEPDNNHVFSLIKAVTSAYANNRGGLSKPSHSVVRVCNVTERLLQKLLCLTDQNLPQGPGVPEALERAVLQEVGTDRAVFYDMLAHMLDTEPDNNHVFSLIKAATSAYANVRMHQVAKQHIIHVTGKYVRKTMAKTVLFKQQ